MGPLACPASLLEFNVAYLVKSKILHIHHTYMLNVHLSEDKVVHLRVYSLNDIVLYYLSAIRVGSKAEFNMLEAEGFDLKTFSPKVGLQVGVCEKFVMIAKRIDCTNGWMVAYLL